VSSFFDVVEHARSLLEAHGRVSMRGLRRELSVDDETLEDLAEELVETQQVATREGNTLVWLGPTAASATSPAPPAAQPPSQEAPVSELSPAGAEVEVSTEVGRSGERRQLTVMFCDLVGSTAMAQRLDPEDLRDFLNEYRSACTEATKRFGGHIAQLLGDGVLIYFGYPQAHEDDAGRAVRAGLEIQRLLADRSEQRQIDARIGIHTGLVVVDTSATGDEALALGPTTNIAARIQDVATPGAVVASSATLDLCGGIFLTHSLGEPALKGIDEPIELHEVDTMAGVRSRLAEVAAKPMVGRDREVGLLSDRWEEVQDGRGQVLLLSGDPGMGKSRLVQAWRDELGDSKHLWLDLHCSPFTMGSAFQPLVDLFNDGLTLGETDSPEQATALLVRGLEAMPQLRVELVVPYLLPLLALPASERYPLQETSSEEQRERTFVGLLHLMLNLTEQQPVVLVAEDLQWCDPSTLEYFERMVQQAATTRLMLVLTFRPEFRAPWSQSHVTEVKLSRLSRRVTRDMITNAAGGRLPEPVLAQLESRSDGVPLFIEELARGVVTSGIMTAQDGRYELRGSVNDLAIPSSLQDSLMARLDRLSASKQVAQEAATLGREFSYALIEAVSDLEPPALRTALEQLVTAEVLHRRGMPPDASYSFKHALLRDTAYESQLMTKRRALHARVVAVLEERFPKRVESEPEVLARHCAAAGSHVRAVDHYQRAAELALARHSNHEASRHFASALDVLALLPDDDERKQREIALRLAQRKPLAALEGYRAQVVVDALDRVDELCQAFQDGPQRLPALLGLVQADNLVGDMISCHARAQTILRIAEPLGIPQLLAVAHYMIGNCAMLATSATEADERMTQALAIAATTEFPAPATPDDLDLLSMIPVTHAMALAQCARPEAAMAALSGSRERAAEFGNDFTRFQSVSLMGIVGYLLHDPEFTKSVAEEAMALGAGRGFHSAEVMATICGGWARASLGDVETGVRDVERGVALAESSGTETGLSLLYVATAHVYRMAGDLSRAEHFLARADERSERNGEGAMRIQIAYARARNVLELGTGDPHEAERLLLEVIALACEQGRLSWELLASTDLARLAPQIGNSRDARDRLAGYYARLSEGLERLPALEAKAALDELDRTLAAEEAAS
jgi:class 3 adenylate cyclase